MTRELDRARTETREEAEAIMTAARWVLDRRRRRIDALAAWEHDRERANREKGAGGDTERRRLERSSVQPNLDEPPEPRLADGWPEEPPPGAFLYEPRNIFELAADSLRRVRRRG
jgi:hypothetical protein